MRKLHKHIILFAILYSFLSSNSVSNEVIIYNDSQPSKDTIDMGMCLVGEEIKTTFKMENHSKISVKFGKGDASYKIYQRKELDSSDAFLQFKEIGSLERTLQSGESNTLDIRYTARPISSFEPEGKNYAGVRFGFWDPAKYEQPANDSQLVEPPRDFILLARKTSDSIDGFDHVINFDTVYLNPTFVPQRTWIVQNSSGTQLQVEGKRIEPKKPKTKIQNDITVPFNFPGARSQKDFHITYYPDEIERDLGQDSAYINLIYQPDPAVPSKKDTTTVKVYGVCIIQSLDIVKVDSGAELKNNIIELGEVPVDSVRDVVFRIQNKGNLHFGITSQKILDLGSGTPSPGFSITRPLIDSTYFLMTNTDTVRFRFQPKDRGEINARYVVGSDIFKRKISGAPDSSRNVEFLIHAKAIAPEINTFKTIDFGNIVINMGNCPAARDTALTVSNLGNVWLKIKSIKVEPAFPSTPFDVVEDNLDIPPKSSLPIHIKFKPIATRAEPYKASLVLISNSYKPLDTFVVKLNARGVFPDSTIVVIPDSKAKPGRRISIPVIVNSSKIKNAKTYTDTIIYDNTLLRYFGNIIAGTASELSNPVLVQENPSGGILNLSIGNDLKTYFLERDTLLHLLFDTYLGERVSTSVAMLARNKFGDGVCEGILTPLAANGTFELDSVCGLNLKTGSQPLEGFGLSEPAPNTVNDIVEFEFRTGFTTNVDLNVYNSYGLCINTFEYKNLKSGNHRTGFSLHSFSPGIYYIEMKAGIFRQIIPFIKSE